MATNLPVCFLIQLLEQLLKFLVNFTLLKYVKSQRSYGFLITKKLIFWLPVFGFKSSLLSLLKIDLDLTMLFNVYFYIENHEPFGQMTKNCPKLDKNRSIVSRFSVFVVYESVVSSAQKTNYAGCSNFRQ